MIRNKKFQKNLEKHRLKKWNDIKQKELLSERTLVDYNTAENLDIKRKEMQEDSKFNDFPKNLQNVTDSRQYRKRGTKRSSDVVKSVDSSTKEVPENSKTIVDLKNIQPILLRDENLKSSKIQDSPPDICPDSSSSSFSSPSVDL